jgi:2-keto-3-deoxy-L-rhamnonate aldolase RhmA
MRQQNEDSLVAIQIENAQAIENVEQIAAVPDVDLLFVGPADLSQSLGVAGQWNHSRLWEAIDRVARTVHQRKVPWGILPTDVGMARRCVENGCRMFLLGLDVKAVFRGWSSYRQEYAEVFGLS